jgi:carbon storage regulator
MLVLSRKVDEKIIIDGGIVITVVDIDRGKVRLGIDAPKHVQVHREEVVERYATTVSTLDGPKELPDPA